MSCRTSVSVVEACCRRRPAAAGFWRLAPGPRQLLRHGQPGWSALQRRPGQRGGTARCFGSFQITSAELDAVRRSKATWPAWLQREMRSNWAGETGAVAIYRGCEAGLERLACLETRASLEAFASEHAAAEEAHLAAVSVVVSEPRERSWMPATTFGWWLGYASTAARGARGMYVTTHAVESFVEEHYGSQISRLEVELDAGVYSPSEAYSALLALLRKACADEVEHKEEALQRVSASSGATALADRLQFSVVYWGSRVGAALAKRV